MRTEYAIMVEHGSIEERDVVGPKDVVRPRHPGIECFAGLARGIRALVALARYYAHKAVLCQRTTCPATGGVRFPPRDGLAVRRVIFIKQAEQHTHVQQGANGQPAPPSFVKS